MASPAGPITLLAFSRFAHQGALPAAGEGQSWLVRAPPFPQVLKPFLTPRSRHWRASGGRRPKSAVALPRPGSGCLATPTRAPFLERKRSEGALCAPGVPDPPPSPLVTPRPPSRPRNNGHILSFLGSGNLPKRTRGSHAELQVNLGGLPQNASCRDLCSIFMDYGLCQTLGNEAAIQCICRALPSCGYFPWQTFS